MDGLKPVPSAADPALAGQARRRASLGIQIEAMQATLVRLLQDVIDAEARLDDTRAAQLVEANEQLVVSSLASRVEADTAAGELDELRQAAEVDALTRLPNRRLLVDRFTQAVASARRHGTKLALLFVDLDDFKRLNDQHGHAFGDRVLRLAAERLVSAVREIDTVSRHGGDEFLTLLTELQQPPDAAVVADKLSEALAAPAVVDGRPVPLAASIGMAVYPDDGEDLETLTARADVTMYARKRVRAALRVPGLPGAAGAPLAPATDAVPPMPPGPAGAADDTARRLAELREVNEQLLLSALGAQALRDAADQARHRQAAFVDAVTEELRNPMAPIRIATAMLGRLPGEAPLLPRVRQVIEQQMTQMSHLVARLVDASAGEGAGLVLDRRRVDMAAVTDAAVAVFRPTLQRHRLRLAWQPPSAPIDVVGDAARLEQIVANLLDNACTHTPDGGRIGLSLVVLDDTVVLTVADDGMGIATEALPEVFEPFAVDLHALDFHGVGLGVGLAVARALVQAHDGHIAAHSDGTRRGSRFVVTLPLADLPPDGPSGADDAAAGPRIDDAAGPAGGPLTPSTPG
jgi:diguanylate cyclase (GGDEF)-like protein